MLRINSNTQSFFSCQHCLLQLCANVLLDRSHAPYFHKQNIPIIPRHDNPASSETPPAIPRFINIGLANKMHETANRERHKSFAANSEAAYLGYDRGRYTKTLWKMIKLEVIKIVTAMRLTIQCMSLRTVHPNMKYPAESVMTAKIAGTRRCSGARKPFLRMSGSK